MKKSRLFAALLLALVALSSSLVLTSCGKHKHSYSAEWVKNGSAHWQACSGCDAVRYEAAHDWNAGVVTQQPTGTSEGVRTFTCLTCEHTRIESIPMLHVHSFADSWSSSETHHWHAATCEHTTEKKDYGEHAWNAGEITTQPTVTSGGEKIYTCQGCGKTKLEKLDPIHVHVFDKMTVDTAYLYSTASCITKESYYYSCACGEKGTAIFERGDFTGHSFTVYLSDLNATCTEDGTKTASCDVCKNATDRIADVGSAKGHAYSDVWSTNSTYHWYASTCGHAEETLGYGKHSWDDGVITKQPTATADGEKVYTCADCKMTRSEIIWIADHVHTYATEYSSDETDHWYASSCGHAGEIKDKAPHRWDAGTVSSPATLYDEGVMLFTCLDCHSEREEAIAKLPSFTVVFYGVDNRILARSNYALGTVSEQILLPSVTPEEGFAFDGWVERTDGKPIADIDFTGAEQDAVYAFRPSFTTLHRVVFVDHDGNPIGDAITVRDGETIGQALLPSIPERVGYHAAWDNAILTERITESKVYTPIYEIITFTVTFLDAKGGHTIATRVVEYGSFAMLPECEPYRFSTKLMSFSGWRLDATDELAENVDASKITGIYSDLTLYASYESSLTEPVLAVHIEGTTVSLSLCLPDGTALYSISASMSWAAEKGIVKITSYAIADLSWLEGDYCRDENALHIGKENWFTHNNKAQTLDLVWGCGVGHAFSTDENTVTVKFSTQDVSNFKEEVIFSLLDRSTVVYGAVGADVHTLQKSDVNVWIY